MPADQTPETPETEPAEETPETPEVPEDGDTFPRSYVEQLRRENAESRTKATAERLDHIDARIDVLIDGIRELLREVVTIRERFDSAR